MLKPALTLAMLMTLAGTAAAGERRQGRHPAPPPEPVRSYGQVHNYYGPVTIYAAPDGGAYPAANYPAYGASYGYGYATPPECDANCYGAGYDWGGRYDYGYGYSGGYAYPGAGYGYGYPAYGYGRAYPSSVPAHPWAGYNWAPGNGYW